VGDWLGVISGTLLVAMMTLIFVNIVLRQLSRIWPDVFRVWVGTVEVVGWTAALIAGFALLYSQKKRAHIAIDIITSRINQRVRAIIVGIMLLADAVLFGMAVNRVVYLALDLRGRGGLPPRLSDTLQIPYWWAVMILAVLVGLFAIRLLVDSMMSFQKAATEEVAEQ
jgi:TRAP-type C4-dicarboxylate transport system permease small subunit